MPDTKLHPPILRQLGIFRLEILLNLHRAAHGIDYTGELGQQIITRRIDYPSAVVLDEGRDHDTIGRESANGGLFIIPHKAAVASDVSTDNRRQLASHTDCGRLTRHRFSSLAGDYSAGDSGLSTVDRVYSFMKRVTLLSFSCVGSGAERAPCGA